MSSSRTARLMGAGLVMTGLMAVGAGVGAANAASVVPQGATWTSADAGAWSVVQGRGGGRGLGGAVAKGRRGGTTGGQGQQGSGTHSNIPAAVPGATISTQVEQMLTFMVQEEKLARDVYALAAAKYGDRIFSNIGRSEAAHMAELRVLLDRYGVTDPTATLAAGQFADRELADLYAELAEQVSQGRAQALAAGVAVEQADIADLQQGLRLDAPADVKAVLGNLLAGSNRHLAAFNRRV